MVIIVGVVVVSVDSNTLHWCSDSVGSESVASPVLAVSFTCIVYATLVRSKLKIQCEVSVFCSVEY